MKTLSKLLLSFVLLGSLVSCGSDGGSSGSSSNAGSTDSGSVISNQCTTDLKNYIETYAGKLEQLSYNKPKYLDIKYRVEEGSLKYGYFVRSDYNDGTKRVNSGANKAELLRLVKNATECSKYGSYTRIKIGKEEHFINPYIVPEANPVRTITINSETDVEIYSAIQAIPEGWTSYDVKDIWQEIKDIF